jgi:hypothetical protein
VFFILSVYLVVLSVFIYIIRILIIYSVFFILSVYLVVLCKKEELSGKKPKKASSADIQSVWELITARFNWIIMFDLFHFEFSK